MVLPDYQNTTYHYSQSSLSNVTELRISRSILPNYNNTVYFGCCDTQCKSTITLTIENDNIVDSKGNIRCDHNTTPLSAMTRRVLCKNIANSDICSSNIRTRYNKKNHEKHTNKTIEKTNN